MKKKKSKVKYIILAIVILIIGFIVYSVIKSADAIKLLTAPEQIEVVKGDMDFTVHGSGAIKSSEEIIIKAPANTTVLELPVKKGDTVKKGDVLAIIDGAELDANITKKQEEIAALNMQISTSSKDGDDFIESEVEGRVKIISVKEDDNIKMLESKDLCIISLDGKMKASFKSSKTLKYSDDIKMTVKDETRDAEIVSIDNENVTVTIDYDSYKQGEQCTIKDSDDKTIGSSSLEINCPYVVSAYEGIIEDIDIEEDDYIYKGTRLFTLYNNDLSDEYKDLLYQREVKTNELNEYKAQKNSLKQLYENGGTAKRAIIAEHDGIISVLTTTERAPVQEGMEILRYEVNEKFELVMAVDELDIDNVKIDQEIIMKADAINDKEYKGKVTRISGIGTQVNNVTTYDVTMELNENERLLSGMSASADIMVDSRENVIKVPVSALKTIDGEKYVTKITYIGKEVEDNKLREFATEDIKVKVGLNNGLDAEILEGINEGDFVQSQHSNQNMFSMMGGQMGNRETVATRIE